MFKKNKNDESVGSLRALIGCKVLVLAVAIMAIPGVALAAKGGNGKGGGNGGNVGGDVSGWIFIDVQVDDENSGDLGTTNGLVSDVYDQNGDPVPYESNVDRVEAAVGKARRHPRVAERRAQEHLAQRSAIGIVVARLVSKPIGLELFAQVVVGHRQDLARTRVLTVEMYRFVQDFESIPEPEVAVEVEIPLKYVGHHVGQLGLAPGVL